MMTLVGFFLAHENVNYTVWEESSRSYQIEYDFFFEPYYVVCRAVNVL